MIRIALLSGLGHTIVVVLGLLIYVLGTRINHQRRHPSAALGWVLGMVTLPYLTLPLFLLFGVRKFARPGRRHHWQAPPPQLPGPPWAAQLLAGMEVAPAVRNRRIVLHQGGAEALAGLLATIDAAQHQLDVGTYVFAHDDVGRQVARALLQAVRRGVAVRLLVDAVGSLTTPWGLLRGLAREGVQVRRFMPLLHNPLRGHSNLRNHRKLVVADGARLWSGGRNLACEYFLDRPGRPAWVDLSFEIHGPLAQHAHIQFGTDWRISQGRTLRRMRRAPHMPLLAGPPHGALAQWIASGPDHADDTVHALLMAGAFHARTRIVAVTPYFVPDDALLDAWCLACRRGVQVSVLVPARSNHRLADIARERALRQLVAAGARVWLSPAMLHAKAVLIDDDLALAGSVNLDARSLFLNYEAMTAFYGPDEVRWLSEWCAALVTQARPHDGHAPSLARDLVEGVVRALGFQL
ncbi:cardiolipin synthase [Oryzisolibacter propanilivorax]|uniref:Cardiolipin synthase n=1 Tax=Oryzisolibacter propanilivorax TaxID=1527607 RepID=A0A1G9RLK4_9BURK|nr:phospholipase D-like domain-containing protein [Oryzisolibacter propanilivorax]SDM24136.1 cardiolipin synthase [Oryzisolibacter propanilivorax]